MPATTALSHKEIQMKSHRVTVKFPRSCEEKDVECKRRFYVSRGWGGVRINGEAYDEYALCCLVEALLYNHRHTVNHVSVDFPSYPKYKAQLTLSADQKDQLRNHYYEEMLTALNQWKCLGGNPRVGVWPQRGSGYIFVSFNPQHCSKPRD